LTAPQQPTTTPFRTRVQGGERDACDAVIVEAIRTPIGKGKPTGALAGVRPVDGIGWDVRPVRT
jgi:hypothetical protein